MKKKINNSGMDGCHCETGGACDSDRGGGTFPGGWHPDVVLRNSTYTLN